MLLVWLAGHQVLELGVEGASRTTTLSIYLPWVQAWLLYREVGRMLSNPLSFWYRILLWVLLTILLLLADEIAVTIGWKVVCLLKGCVVAVFLLGSHLNRLVVIHVGCTGRAELLVTA